MLNKSLLNKGRHRSLEETLLLGLNLRRWAVETEMARGVGSQGWASSIWICKELWSLGPKSPDAHPPKGQILVVTAAPLSSPDEAPFSGITACRLVVSRSAG